MSFSSLFVLDCSSVNCISSVPRTCYFPFQFEGKNYSTCITLERFPGSNSKEPWCATKQKCDRVYREYIWDWCFCGKSFLLSHGAQISQILNYDSFYLEIMDNNQSIFSYFILIFHRTSHSLLLANQFLNAS